MNVRKYRYYNSYVFHFLSHKLLCCLTQQHSSIILLTEHIEICNEEMQHVEFLWNEREEQENKQK